MGKVTHRAVCSQIYIVINSWDVLLVLSSTSTHKPGSHQHTLNTQSTCLMVFSDGEESNCHHYTYSDSRLDDWRKLTCTADSTPKILVWRCHPPAMWKTVRWSLVFLRGENGAGNWTSLFILRLLQVTSGGWIDGAEERYRETKRKRHRFFGENKTSSLLICRGGLGLQLALAVQASYHGEIWAA